MDVEAEDTGSKFCVFVWTFYHSSMTGSQKGSDTGWEPNSSVRNSRITSILQVCWILFQDYIHRPPGCHISYAVGILFAFM